MRRPSSIGQTSVLAQLVRLLDQNTDITTQVHTLAARVATATASVYAVRVSSREMRVDRCVSHELFALHAPQGFQVRS